MFSIKLEFTYNKIGFQYTIVPEEEDWWVGIDDFDIHVSFEYNEVCVYLANNTRVLIHKQPIRHELQGTI